MLQQDDFKEYLICSGEVTSLRNITESIFEKLNLDFDKHVKVEQSLMRNA